MVTIEISELDSESSLNELTDRETGSVQGEGNDFAFNQNTQVAGEVFAFSQNTQVAGEDVEGNDVDQDADANGGQNELTDRETGRIQGGGINNLAQVNQQIGTQDIDGDVVMISVIEDNQDTDDTENDVNINVDQREYNFFLTPNLIFSDSNSSSGDDIDSESSLNELTDRETGSVQGEGNNFAFNQNTQVAGEVFAFSQNTQVAGEDVEGNDVDQDADADGGQNELTDRETGSVQSGGTDNLAQVNQQIAAQEIDGDVVMISVIEDNQDTDYTENNVINVDQREYNFFVTPNLIFSNSNSSSGDDKIVLGNGNGLSSDGNIIIDNDDWSLVVNRNAISGDVDDLLNGGLGNIMNGDASNNQFDAGIKSLIDQLMFTQGTSTNDSNALKSIGNSDEFLALLTGIPANTII